MTSTAEAQTYSPYRHINLSVNLLFLAAQQLSGTFTEGCLEFRSTLEVLYAAIFKFRPNNGRAACQHGSRPAVHSPRITPTTGFPQFPFLRRGLFSTDTLLPTLVGVEGKRVLCMQEAIK